MILFLDILPSSSPALEPKEGTNRGIIKKTHHSCFVYQKVAVCTLETGHTNPFGVWEENAKICICVGFSV